MRVTFGLPIQSARGIARAIDSVRAAASLPPSATTQATGYLPLYVRMMTLLTDSLIRSFGLALLVILGMIGLLFWSARMALLSLLPNGLPILIALGLMGWLAVPLDVATMTIAAIVLGLVVDDTVHLLHGYVQASETHSPAAALRESAQRAGPRMTITTGVLTGGFLVLCLSQLTSIVWFGVLSAVALTAALAADLLVLPSLVAGLYGGVQDS